MDKQLIALTKLFKRLGELDALDLGFQMRLGGTLGILSSGSCLSLALLGGCLVVIDAGEFALSGALLG